MLLNRSAILITPKAPYIVWANSVAEAGPTYEESSREEGPPIFLGPELESLEDGHAFITQHWDLFFDEMLGEWCSDPQRWPARRDYRMFQDWFLVEIRSQVVDTVDAPFELE